MKKVLKQTISLSFNFYKLPAIKAITNGLINIIPILLVGAVALTLNSFPIEVYQSFLSSFLNGFFKSFLSLLYEVTFGLLSIHICLSISFNYATNKAPTAKYTAALLSIACFIVLTGYNNLSIDTLGPKGMFISIVSAIASTKFFCYLVNKLPKFNLMVDGGGVHYNNAISQIFPFVISLVVIVTLNQCLLLISGGINIHDIFLNCANALFKLSGGGFFSGLLFVLLSSILWFFGIHGSDVLEGVCNTLFTPNININISLVNAGLQPTEILTKQFFDIFVLMGGCGSAICLLIALFLFSKRKSNKNLAKLAAGPMIFNINELMIFGLPIIYNPSMLIPFLIVPVVCYLTSYTAMSIGLVPLTISQVEWTIPIVLGGYLGTGSIIGSLLQLFNLVIGVLIYRPFIIKYEKQQLVSAQNDYKNLVAIFKEHERNHKEVKLTELPGQNGVFAKALASDLINSIDNHTINIYYQPQYNYKNECIGVEALLRYDFANIGYIYPPLVIKLAKESQKIEKLEEYIFNKAFKDLDKIYSETNKVIPISINISGKTIQSKSFEQFLIDLANKNQINKTICIEITEQEAVIFNEEFKQRILKLKEVGYTFAIDDFSAGSTSLHYLQESYFDVIKLDGILVQNCLTNERSLEIVSNIISLSHTLGFKVLAEYISSEELRDSMHNLGCNNYQGWLYSKPLPLNKLIEKLIENKK